ncbi:MAG: PhoH family protein [bacterium]|nr:PhoH family protein [bacterium]
MDTSMLVHDPNCLEGFPDDMLIITPWTIDELDHLKRSEGERGEHALQALRKIHEYSAGGDFTLGITMQNGSILKAESVVSIPSGIEHSAANKNIFLAKRLMDGFPTQAVIIISKDINRRIKASMLGVSSGDYGGEGGIHDPYAIFPGCSEISLKSSALMTKLHREGSLRTEAVECMADFAARMLIPNQCVRFMCEDKETLAVYKHSKGLFRLVPKPKTNGNGKAVSMAVAPKNCEQAFAYSLLMDPEIRLAALVGSAGSGKTLMSLLAAKEHLRSEFERGTSRPDASGMAMCNQIIVFRPNVEMGNPLGFLPGTLEEKFEPWMYPILDNLDLILHDPETRPKGGKQTDPVADFIDSGMIQMSPINHVRGRSLHDAFIIIDEAQNLTKHQIRSLITRTGKGSKVILTGDISQIDDPYLDQTSNGLSHVISKFMGQEIFGYTIMKRGEERSLLAKLASDLL